MFFLYQVVKFIPSSHSSLQSSSEIYQASQISSHFSHTTRSLTAFESWTFPGVRRNERGFQISSTMKWSLKP